MFKEKLLDNAQYLYLSCILIVHTKHNLALCGILRLQCKSVSLVGVQWSQNIALLFLFPVIFSSLFSKFPIRSEDRKPATQGLFIREKIDQIVSLNNDL